MSRKTELKWYKWRSCEIKTSYSMEEADLASKEAFKRSRNSVVPYKCNFCPDYHIGHELNEKAKKRLDSLTK